MINLRVTRSKVGVAFFGGCGSNILRLTMNKHDPADYPDFFLFGADTDSKVQSRHFGNQDDESQKRWENFLTVHQLGGMDVTKGRGAGANPEIGRLAAETEGSMRAMTDFYKKVDELILVGGAGGGTGSGAMPVAARLAVEMGKPTLAIVVLPEPEDGRTKRATEALSKIQAQVPTIPIRNAYLKEIMEKMSPEERAKITFKDAWNIVDENSLVPMLLILREIIQVTGDMINIDESDWEAMLKYGNHVYFGLARVDQERLQETSAETIVSDLFASHFQDPGLIEQGKVIGLWGHGPWPKEKTEQIVKLIKTQVCTSRSLSFDDVEAHKGIIHNIKDNKMWMALLIVAEELPSGKPFVPVVTKPSTNVAIKKTTEKSIAPLPPMGDELPKEVLQLGFVRFRSEGIPKEISVNRDLATRFSRAYGNIYATREELEKIFREIREACGCEPDMPERFNPEIVPETGPGIIARWFPRRLSTN